MKKDNKVYDIITDKIIGLLEKGIVPWEQKWDVQLPQNFASKRQYTGFNFFYLYCMALGRGYKSSYWLTFNQIQALKGKLKAGQYNKAEIVIFYRMKPWVDKDDLDKNGQPKKKMYPILRFYDVYNIEQTEGIAYETGTHKNLGIEACEAIVESYKDHPEITHVNGQAPCYIPLQDKIHVPEKTTYKTSEYYYKSLFHEFTHSTGHEKRLNRFQAGESTNFGSEVYSKEELIAELGTAFLCAEAGISNEDTLTHSASYIGNWLQALKNDKKLIIQASGKAQNAVDYIKGIEKDVLLTSS